MAIVSISRIQHRRGLQQDLPSLASAELGWSIDQQKLYIGNGTTAEGAPRLGNTEILTEYSDVLNLAKTYSYVNEDAGYSPTTGGRTTKFNAVAYNGISLYVAVGNSGAVLTSTDSITWSPVYANTTDNLNDICFGNGLFVAVGANGTIINSSDGITWTKSTNRILINLNSITFASGTINNYVAVSDTGEIIISVDSNAWTSATSGISTKLTSIGYNDNLLVAVGDSGTIITSTNSTVWTIQSVPTSYNLRSVKYSHDQWIAAGDTSIVLISIDGINWGYGYTDTFRASAKSTASGITIFVGDGGVIYKTSDVSLVMVASPTTQNLYDVTFAGGLFVAVGANGTIIVSEDGVNWLVQTSGVAYDLYSVTFNTVVHRYVVVGEHGTILTSPLGYSWTSQNSGTTYNLYGVALWSTTTYIAVGSHGKILTSTNGTTWTSRVSGETNDLESIAIVDLDGGTYQAVTVGTNGVILVSNNSGLNWTSQTNPSSEDLHAVNYCTWTYNSNSFYGYVAVGNNGTVVYSNDSLTWTQLDFPTVSHLWNVYYLNNTFWVIGSIGYTSVYGSHILDSGTLTSQSLNILYNTSTGYNGPTLYNSSYAFNYYVIVGQYDTILTSLDGQNFYSQTQRNFTLSSLNTADILDCIVGYQEFLAVGNKGLILRSIDGVNWNGISYVYGSSSTVRTLQHKLDEFVSVKDFGAKGDGLTDDTESINRALYELYCRSANASARKALYFPAGNYIVSDGIKVPTDAILIGEGNNNTVIQQTADPAVVSYVMITADSKQQVESQIGYNGATLPSSILVRDIGLNAVGDGVWLTNSSRLTLERVRMSGTQSLPSSAGNEWCGVYVLGSSLATPTDINIIDCYIEQFNYGLLQPDTEYSRNIVINSTSFINLYSGIQMNKNDGMVNTMTVSNCVFDLIAFKAIDTNFATNITSTFNSYRDVANNYLGIGNAVAVVIDFGTQSIGCTSINDQFDRQENETIAFPWVSGNQNTSAWFGGIDLRIGLFSQQGGELYTLNPAQTNANTGVTYLINDNGFNQHIQYVIKRGSATRTGTLFIAYNPAGNTFNIDDESSETDDVGVTFNLNSFVGSDTNIYLTLQYTSTSGGSSFTLSMAENYVKTAW